MSNFESFDGINIWYEYTQGTGPVLVFLHGWVNNWTSWKKEVLTFQKKGYATLVLDLRGHGQSDKPESQDAYILPSFAKDVAGIIRHEQISDYVILGHSMGGMIALTLFKENLASNCSGLILCNTTGQSVLKHTPFEQKSPFLKEVIGFLEKKATLKKKHFSHLSDIDISEYKNGIESQIFFTCLAQTPMVSVLACLDAMMNYDVTKVLPKIKVPVLVIGGEKDVFLPKIDSIELYEGFTDADLKMVQGGRHFVQITHAKEVETLIGIFLKKLVR